MKVKIKRLHRDAVIPSKKYERDFCYDCKAVSCEEIAPHVYRYGLGFALQMPSDADFLLSVDVRPRSSVWKTGMVLSNCQGTVDENYRGEISAVFYHVFPEMPRYEIGDRVCQIKLGITAPVEFEDVETLEDSDRGSNGYGSTGR